MASAEESKDSAATKPTITLHWLEKSRSQRILWMLEEIKAPYVMKTYKRGSDLLAEKSLQNIHPLGKSPTITIDIPGETAPITIAESGLIVEYISEHYGSQLLPTRWKAGKENTVGGETDAWLRYRYFMHYAEGSLMTILLIGFLMQQLRKAPFLVRPITSVVAGQVDSKFLLKNYKLHFEFLEDQIKTAPPGGFFAGELSAADIMMVYPLESALSGGVLDGAKYPALKAYVQRCHDTPSYKAAIEKVKEQFGKYEANL